MPRNLEEMQGLVIKHLQPNMQALQDEGVEVVVIVVEKDDPPGGQAGIAGTVRSPGRVYAILEQATREMLGQARRQDKLS
jgi:glycine/D-amino acid oxidase-like deaminating enzyme